MSRSWRESNLQLFLKAQLKFVNFFIRQQKNVTINSISSGFLMGIPKWGLPVLCRCILKVIAKKQKNTTFVRFSDYQLNIPLRGHNSLIEIVMPQFVYL
jgi:hypothetical protein